jgi:DNA-binding CsgD family transcriptional regulator
MPLEREAGACVRAGERIAMKADPVRIIEAGYTHFPGETSWLAGLLDASAPYDVGGGVLALTVDLGERPRVREICASPEAAGAAPSIESFVRGLSQPLARAMFAPSEFVGNGAWRLNRISSTPSSAVPHAPRRAPALPPIWGLSAGDGTKHAVVVAFPASPRDFAPDKAFPHRDRRLLGLVGAHLGAALRLRAAARADARPEDGVTEAVLSPSGRVLDAGTACQSRQTRRSLSEAVLRAERARGKLRRTDEAEATNLWKALVAGRWSIVEIVERDGKRLLLARANRPEYPDQTALTAEENDVVWLATLGHSYKYIGYELGLTVSSVVRRLNRAMTKLGVSTRSELVRKLAR